ncbi:uncharacterized protein SAPINGB_P006006 [Magnusiomyces paraingens]|uniref:Uncharacterized protein n=1 Tax=Magnusiomyces paraingens TaxID=2606893 RepID=A0A5E8C7Z1_9ASCO|nr:uncharacterized protein SAPINGB_P006006 [Saprochaete ingens]VVT58038.1 unnamed protein product [Saprochaete ingens]
MSLVVTSQVSFQVVLFCFDVACLILGWAVLMFFSTINNSAAQIANAFSSIVGLWDTFIGETRRKVIRESEGKDRIEVGRALMSSPDPYLSPESSRQGLFNKNGSSYPPTTTPILSNEPSVKHVRKRLPFIFAFFLLVIRYVPVPLHIVFGYAGKPEPENLYIPLANASNYLDTIPNFYDENTTPLYNVGSNYQASDAYDESKSSYLFPLFNSSMPWSLQGSTFFRQNGVTCLITDRFEEMIMQTGFLAHYNAYPSLPVLPILKCKEDSSGYSMFVTNSNYTGNSTLFQPYTTAIKTVLGVGQNVSGISIDPTNKKINVTTVIIDDYSFENVPVVDNSTLWDMMNKSFPVNESLSAENDWAVYNKEDIVSTKKSLDSALSLMQSDFVDEISYVMSYSYYNSSASSDSVRSFCRTMFSYNGVGGYISVSKLYYSTRQLSYDITKNSDEAQPYFKVQQSNDNPQFLNVQVLALITDIKIGPTVGGALLRKTGYQADGLQNVLFEANGKLIYDIKVIFGSILGVIGVSFILLFIIYVIWHDKPKGIPFYYALLHEYHQKTSNIGCDRSIFDMVTPAYEGEGYVESKCFNHIGVLDEKSVAQPPRASVPYSDK